jgi:predicted DNA-binding transcriptional regulator AlpA
MSSITYPEFLMQRQAEAYCGYRAGTFYALRKRGIAPPSHSIKGVMLYWKNDLDEWLAQRRKEERT